eukprot:scaffold9123_cov121-Isochrysis_galbana.AAC.1
MAHCWTPVGSACQIQRHNSEIYHSMDGGEDSVRWRKGRSQQQLLMCPLSLGCQAVRGGPPGCGGATRRAVYMCQHVCDLPCATFLVSCFTFIRGWDDF